MAILTPEDYMAGTGQTFTGSDLVAITTMCAEVSDLIARMCYPTVLEPKTLTLAAFDAPITNVLLLPKPIRSITAIYVHYDANGDSSVLTSADLLTAGEDYYSPIDDPFDGLNRSGKVFRRGPSQVWGWERRYPIGLLAPAIESNKGAVFVSGLFGQASVNPIAQSAARAAVSLLYARRKAGAPLNSESWNGYSSSVSGQFTATAAVNSPDVLDALRSGGLLGYHVGGA